MDLFSEHELLDEAILQLAEALPKMPCRTKKELLIRLILELGLEEANKSIRKAFPWIAIEWKRTKVVRELESL
jgi:hypothetical protein